MNFIAVVMTVFSVIGALDHMLGNRCGIGQEFEKGFSLFGRIALAMIGMIVLAPALGRLIMPAADFIYGLLGIDPSIIPCLFLANDMGGYALSEQIAKDPALGAFNGLVVSSMMGVTVSYTIPVALGIVKKEKHKLVFLGFLCGIITIPIGCFVSGLMLKINILHLLQDLSPMIVFSAILALSIAIFPNICIKVFNFIGIILKTVIIFGLALGIIEFLTGFEVIKDLAPLEEGAMICVNACVVLSGAFPLLHILSKILSKPLTYMGKKMGINEVSAFNLFSTLVTSLTTYQNMEETDEKGTVLNAAFAISGAFTFASHLAFTLATNSEYVWYVIAGKLISGISALILALFIYSRTKNLIK